MKTYVLKGRCLNPGRVEAKLYTIPGPASFYGELEKGFDDNIILLMEAHRGSTVAPYVIYKLARRGRAPRAVLVWRDAEPMIIAGCVLAGIPLADRMGASSVIRLDMLARLECDAILECPERGGVATAHLRCR